ncbi:hypothetical protein NA57DRAFT_58065 [Rhizodiscina lignyota]|uniref:Uncharacterized protein n=1 Tax=Rhizodiscina lignyota TaxID=1504668 RepID=A0A9P4M556_9PEZI|nr:hypothetical protein NA57DRAFT_58065 [Rhizodiscina lignyota]
MTGGVGYESAVVSVLPNGVPASCRRKPVWREGERERVLQERWKWEGEQTAETQTQRFGELRSGSLPFAPWMFERPRIGERQRWRARSSGRDRSRDAGVEKGRAAGDGGGDVVREGVGWARGRKLRQQTELQCKPSVARVLWMEDSATEGRGRCCSGKEQSKDAPPGSTRPPGMHGWPLRRNCCSVELETLPYPQNQAADRLATDSITSTPSPSLTLRSALLALALCFWLSVTLRPVQRPSGPASAIAFVCRRLHSTQCHHHQLTTSKLPHHRTITFYNSSDMSPAANAPLHPPNAAALNSRMCTAHHCLVTFTHSPAAPKRTTPPPRTSPLAPPSHDD